MKTRLYLPADYPVIEPWFGGHGSMAVPEKVLPKCGVVVEDAGQLCAAVWLYQDNSVSVGWLAWLVSNHALSPQKAATALELAVGACQAVAAGLGYTLLFTMTEKPALGRFLQRQGFVPNHSGMTQYWRPI